MTNRLDRSVEDDVAEAVVDSLEEEGVPAEQSIPGLVVAIQDLAYGLSDSHEIIEEATALLNG